MTGRCHLTLGSAGSASRVRVSFQGECGAYSEEAALAFFPGAITIPSRSFGDALRCAAEGNAEFAILPVENSIAGSVGESIDVIYGTELRATGETYHHIRHCLIGTGALNDVRTVYSHPQALGQCHKFITEYKMRTVPTYDTAGSVRIIKDMGIDAACIASRAAAKAGHIPIIREGIADAASNRTRFLIMGREAPQPTGNDKTSVRISIHHRPSELYHILGIFDSGKVNLTKIESRPKRDAPGEYDFDIDFEGHEADRAISDMLDRIRSISIGFESLGSYPRNPAAF